MRRGESMSMQEHDPLVEALRRKTNHQKERIDELEERLDEFEELIDEVMA